MVADGSRSSKKRRSTLLVAVWHFKAKWRGISKRIHIIIWLRFSFLDEMCIQLLAWSQNNRIVGFIRVSKFIISLLLVLISSGLSLLPYVWTSTFFQFAYMDGVSKTSCILSVLNTNHHHMECLSPDLGCVEKLY